MENATSPLPSSLPAPHFLPSVVDTAGAAPTRREVATYTTPTAAFPVPSNHPNAAQENLLAADGVKAVLGGVQPGDKASLRFHDGSVLVLQPGTSRFNVGSFSIPAFSRLKPPECRKRIERQHLSFSFHDGVVAVSSDAGSCGHPWGPIILRGSAAMPLLRNQPVPLLDADAVFLGLYAGHGFCPIRVSFSSEPANMLPESGHDPRVPALQRALRACESERDRLHRDVASLTEALTDAWG